MVDVEASKLFFIIEFKEEFEPSAAEIVGEEGVVAEAFGAAGGVEGGFGLLPGHVAFDACGPAAGENDFVDELVVCHEVGELDPEVGGDILWKGDRMAVAPVEKKERSAHPF